VERDEYKKTSEQLRHILEKEREKSEIERENFKKTMLQTK